MKKSNVIYLLLAMLSLCIVGFYSLGKSEDAYAGKKATTSGSGWESWNNDDGRSSDDKNDGGDENSNDNKKKKSEKHWETRGNKNIDPDKHFLGTTDSTDLVIKTNNKEQMRITSSGDVGIGVTEPHGEFEVGDRTDPEEGICPPGYVHVDDNENMIIDNGECWRGIILKDGKVGIGTTTPTDRLTVDGNITPAETNKYTLGAENKVWKDIYVGADSLHLDGKALSNENGVLMWGGIPLVIINNLSYVGIDTSGNSDAKIQFTEDGNPKASLFYEGSAGTGVDKSIHIRSEIPGNEQNLMTMKLNGNVGIGTENPGEKLSVDGIIESTNGGFKFPDGSIQTEAGGAGSSLNSPDASQTDVLIVDNNGNVGIGTTSPTAELEVNGTVAASAYSSTSPFIIEAPRRVERMRIDDITGNVGIGTTAPDEKLTFDSGSNADTKILFTEGGAPGASFFYEGSAGSGGNNLVHIRSEIKGKEQNIMTWKLNGNVGIGLANPSQKLSVAGIIESTTGGVKFPDGTTQTTASTGVGSGKFVDGTNPNDAVYTTGNVGIGTTTPLEKLDVAGNINIPHTNSSGSEGVIKSGGVPLIHSFGNNNFFVGEGAGNFTTTGIGNTANGKQALSSNTSGRSNTANGFRALSQNTTGIENTANGSAALISNTTGNFNTANGAFALNHNTTGNNNTANGNQALIRNTTGISNTANGAFALNLNSTGNSNTANGDQALFRNTTGNTNTANGSSALSSNTTGSKNLALGFQTGDNLTTGSGNIIIGSDIDATNPDGNFQMSIGNLIYGIGVDGAGKTVSTGNVGIGLANPSQKLSVAGIIESTTGGVKFPDGTTQTTASTGSGGGKFIDGTNPNDAVYNTGNVGIGTTGPTTSNGLVNRIFEVNAGNDNSVVVLSTGDTDTANVGGILEIRHTGSRTGADKRLGQINTRFDATAGMSSHMILNTNNAGTLNEVMRLASDGNVGIGTVNPISLLTVSSASADDGIMVSNSGTGVASLMFKTGNVSEISTFGISNAQNAYAAGAAQGDFVIDNNSTAKIDLATNNSVRMVIDGSGNVGVGTTTPLEKLDVAGNINIPPTNSSGSEGVIKSGGVPLIHSFGITNFFAGKDAGNFTTTGSGNTANGSEALSSITTGDINTANGFLALRQNTTGTENTANGAHALRRNTTGRDNTVNGAFSLTANTSGNSNTANGAFALNRNSTGNSNTANGTQALSNTTGSKNTALGARAGDNLTAGSGNIIIGSDIDVPFSSGSFQMTIGNLIYGTGVDGAGTTVSTGNVGIGLANPSQKLSVAGIIESTTGGVKFPDGTTQTTASTGGGSGKFVDGTNPIHAVYTTGSVGIGTTAPRTTLHVTTGGNTAIEIESTHPTAGRSYGLQVIGNNDGRFRITDSTAGGIERFTLTASGNIGLGHTRPTHPLHMPSGAHVTLGGVWTNASSRDYKENIQELSEQDAFNTIHNLNPVTYNYKVDNEEACVGFIAEDVPDLVATKDRKSLSPMDIVAVLTKVVQKQQEEIGHLKADNKELKNMLTTMTDRQFAIEDMLLALSTQQTRKLAKMDNIQNIAE